MGLLFVTQKLVGKTLQVNGKTFLVCPNDTTGNAVLVNKGEVTIEVLVLGSERFLMRDLSKPNETHYLYAGESVFYSAYNPTHKSIFEYYSKFF